MDLETPALTKKEVIEAFAARLEETDAELKQIQKRSNSVYKKTTQVIRVVFFSIAVLLVMNLYFIYDFGKGVLTMLNSMEQMYTHFGKVTDEVHTMTKSVANMSDDINALPSMLEQMDSMNQTVHSMNRHVQGMNNEVTHMSKDVKVIHYDMQNMTYRFEQVNRHVSQIGYSVHQMSRAVP